MALHSSGGNYGQSSGKSSDKTLHRKDEKGNGFTSSGDHILLVDDDKLFISMMVKMLERQGYKITPFTDPLRALEKFRENSTAFDLVITDQCMPYMEGTQLIQAIREISPDIPVILWSGFKEDADSENDSLMGAVAFLEKPFHLKDMASAIRRVLENH